MFTRKRLHLILLTALLLGAAPVLAVQPPDGGNPHSHGTALKQVAGSVDFRLELHNVTAHHREMTDKHNQVLGFSGSHVLAVQLLDRESGQALTGLTPKARIVGPDKTTIADGLALKWFVPQGRAPYYGAGLNLKAKGPYTVTVTVTRGQTPVKAAFTVTVP